MTSPQPAATSTASGPPTGGRFGATGEGAWTRSSTDRVVAGVCGGLGRRLQVDPVILRVVVAILAFFAGAGIVLYAAAWLLVPSDRTNQSVLGDALGGRSTERVRSILIAGGLVLVLGIAALVVLDGGLVPALLISLAVIAVLLVVRRDETTPATPTTLSGDRPDTASPVGPQPSGPPAYGAATEPTVRLDPDPGPSEQPPSPPPPGPDDPTLVLRPEPPPPPPRERSYLGLLTVSAMIAVIGGLSIVDLSGVAIPATGYVVAALGVVAAGLVLGAWFGRSRGLIALGISLGLAIGPAIVFDAVAGQDWRDWNRADDITVTPQTPDALEPTYEYGAGAVRLDLTGLELDDETLSTMIDLGAGEVLVTVPPEVDVTVDGEVVIGELNLFDRRSSGFDAADAFTDMGMDGPGGGQLDLSIDLGLGNVEVRRAAS